MNFLIGCDQKYYNDWGINLFKSINHHNPWLQLHCHIVNPDLNMEKLSYVDYTFEQKGYTDQNNKLGYLQACRFVAVRNKFADSDLVMTTDADSICTRAIDKGEFEEVCSEVTFLTHQKHNGFLCGLVTFGTGSFKQDYYDALYSIPDNEWKVGRDQAILKPLHEKHNFKVLDRTWMSVGKHRNASAFLTLKGNDRNNKIYFDMYKNHIV
jgi:hypothetical protein